MTLFMAVRWFSSDALNALVNSGDLMQIYVMPIHDDLPHIQSDQESQRLVASDVVQVSGIRALCPLQDQESSCSEVQGVCLRRG